MSCHSNGHVEPPANGAERPSGAWRMLAILLVGLFVVVNSQDALVTAFRRIRGKGVAATTAAPAPVAVPTPGPSAEPEEKIDANAFLPPDGVRIPVVWDDLGRRLVEAGVIDLRKFESLYARRGGLTEEERRLLDGKGNGALRIDKKNAGFLLNVLWALGLGQKNAILEEGPMRDPRFGGAERFASTGGWTLADGGAMDHYGKHAFFDLSAEQQALVERVAKNIYRPCCNNSTYFPDCNHGMAMLGLLELMADQGADEAQMYRTALQVNAYWFPSQYLTIAKAFEKRGVAWKDVDPIEALGANYSSGSGYGAVAQEVGPANVGGGQGCGT